jgi:hypothetical protein
MRTAAATRRHGRPGYVLTKDNTASSVPRSKRVQAHDPSGVGRRTRRGEKAEPVIGGAAHHFVGIDRPVEAPAQLTDAGADPCRPN